jgi:epsilon-lactone hydrolase
VTADGASRGAPSLGARLVNLALRHVVKRRLSSIDPVDASAARAARARVDRLARLVPARPCGVEVEAVDAGGVPAEWVIPPRDRPGRGVLFLHGGAYVIGSARLYRELTARLARACGARVLVPDYRLAPEHPFPAALEDALTVWEWLLAGEQSADRMLLAGDSAGGGLALATLLELRDAGRALPAAAALLAPWTDLTASGSSVKENEARDPYLPARLLRPVAELYLAGADPRDPRASPLFGDLRGLPPLLLVASPDEILRDDTVRLAAAARSRGVEVTVELWPRMPHVFPLFARLVPEGRRAIAGIGAFAEAHLAAGPPGVGSVAGPSSREHRQ